MEARIAKLNQTIKVGLTITTGDMGNIAKRQMNGCDADYACAFEAVEEIGTRQDNLVR